jgi:hypothetical protein
MVTPAMAIRAATTLDKPALLHLLAFFTLFIYQAFTPAFIISSYMGNARALLFISRNHRCFWTWCGLVFETRF